MEFRHAEAQRNDDIDPGRGHDAVEMHDAKKCGQHCAGDDSEQHRHVGDETGEPTDQTEDHQEHKQRDAQPFKLAVVWIGKRSRRSIDHLGQGRQTAARPIDADPHQRDADYQDDGAGHHRRKQRQKPTHEGRHNDGEHARRYHRSINPQEADVGCRRHRQHGADRGEGDAHHDRQADANAWKSDALDQRRQTAGEKVGADQKGDILGGQFEGAAKNERYRHRARIHDQNVLEAKGHKFRNRQKLIYRMNVLRHRSVPQKRCPAMWHKNYAKSPRRFLWAEGPFLWAAGGLGRSAGAIAIGYFFRFFCKNASERCQASLAEASS